MYDPADDLLELTDAEMDHLSVMDRADEEQADAGRVNPTMDSLISAAFTREWKLPRAVPFVYLADEPGASNDYGLKYTLGSYNHVQVYRDGSVMYMDADTDEEDILQEIITLIAAAKLSRAVRLHNENAED